MAWFFDFVVGGRKQAALKKLTCEQLEDEKIRLEAVQDSLVKKVRNLERAKRALFEEGTRKGSDLEKRALAIKIKQADEEARDYQTQHLLISNRIQLTGKLMRLKRQMGLVKDAGLWSLVANLDPSQVEKFMLDIKARARQGDLQATRLLEILDDGEDIRRCADADVERIVEAMTTHGDADLADNEWAKLSARIGTESSDLAEARVSED